MRIPVEIKPQHHSALLSLAARYGQEGLSQILDEAIESYLVAEATQKEKAHIILSLAASISEEEAENMRKAIQELGKIQWRL